MSTYVDQKLEPVEVSGASRARARLEQLRDRWGCTSPKGERAPDELLVDQLVTGKRERWRLVDDSRGEKAMYELVEVLDGP